MLGRLMPREGKFFDLFNQHAALLVQGGTVLAELLEVGADVALLDRVIAGGAAARRLCPDLVVVPPRWPAYVEASRAVFEVFRRTSPMVEGLSIDYLAAMFQLEKNNVSVRLHRIRLRLQAEMER